ncbi:MAG: hypothetical protein QM644_17395 [Mobilitalea sp.]
MRIILYEMKKIWNIKLLLVITVLCALYYFMFLEFNIKHFPNGHPVTEELNFSIQMLEQSGLTMEEDEFSDFILSTREKLITEAETYIKNIPIFSEAEIYTYEDYKKIHEKSNQSELETTAIWTLLGEECDFVRFKLEALSNIEDRYHNYPEYLLNKLISETTDEKELDRLMEIQESEEYRNIMDGWVFENTVTYAVYLAVLTILAVLVLISPLIVTDHTKNVHLLQYTSKQGRAVFNNQFIAAMISAFLLTTVFILIFGAIYSSNSTWIFWNSGLTSFLNTTFLVNITYGQYIIISVALLYVLCLSAAASAFVLSRFSQNLITLIMKLIPLFAVYGLISVSVLNYTFNRVNIIYAGTGILGIETIVCGFLLLSGLAVSIYFIHKETKIDIT